MSEKDSGKQMINGLGGQIRLEQNNNRLMVSKDNIDVLLVGQQDDGDIVVKLAKPGVDVKTAANDQLILNSAQNVFKIVSTGTFTLTFLDDTQGTSFVVPHGLGYTPAYMIFSESTFTNFTTGNYFNQKLPLFVGLSYDASSGPLNSFITFQLLVVDGVDESNILVDFYSSRFDGGYAGDYTFRYYLLQETAA